MNMHASILLTPHSRHRWMEVEEAEGKVEGEEEEAEGKESVGVCALNLISFLIPEQCMYELKQSNC